MNTLSKVFIITSAILIASPSHAEWVDGSIVKDAINEFIDQTMNHPKAVGGNVVYQLTDTEACEIFMSSSTVQPECVTVASKFKATQLVYVDSVSAGEGKITWSYDDHDLLSFTYGPTVAQIDIKFSNANAGIVALITDLGQDGTPVATNAPSSGAVRLLIDHSVGNVSTMKVSFPEALNHTVGDYQISMAQNSFIQLVTTPSAHLVAASMNLDNSFAQIPGSADPFHSSATIVKYSLGDLHGSFLYDWADGIASTNNFLINNCKIEADSVVALAVNSSAAMTATTDLSNMLYSASSAVDLNLSVLDSAFSIAMGEYKLKSDANALISTDMASTLDVNLKNLLIQAPADQLSAFGITSFTAGTAAKVMADEVSGGLTLANASATYTLNMDAFTFKNFAVKEDATTKLSAHHNSGYLDGSASSDLASSGSVNLAAQDFQVDVVDTLGIPGLSAGTYHLVNGAGTAIAGSYSGSGPFTASYNLNNVSVNAPYGADLVDFAMNAVGTVGLDLAAAGSQNILVGSIGTGHLTIGSENLATWSQSAPTTIGYDASIATLLVSVSDATTINISHNNSIASFGTGSVAIVAGANTALSNMLTTVDSGSATITFTGNPYAALFGAGGMLEGMDSAFTCASGVAGPCSMSVH